MILKKVNERIREHGKVELEHKEHQEFEDKVLRSCDCLKIIVILLTMVAWVVGAGTCNNACVRGVWMLLTFKTSNSPEKLSTTKVLLQTEMIFSAIFYIMYCQFNIHLIILFNWKIIICCPK